MLLELSGRWTHWCTCRPPTMSQMREEEQEAQLFTDDWNGFQEGSCSCKRRMVKETTEPYTAQWAGSMVAAASLEGMDWSTFLA